MLIYGPLRCAQLFDAQDLAQSACQTVLAFIRKSVETKYGAESGPAPVTTRPAAAADAEEEPMADASEENESSDDDKVMIDA